MGEKDVGQNKRDSQDRKERLGGFESQSRETGNHQNKNAYSNSPRENILGESSAIYSRESCFGGILSQLEQVLQSHLSFVDAHTQRLKARLAEDELHRERVINDINQLKQEILTLLEEK